MSEASHLHMRVGRYRAAAHHLREALDLAGEAGASPNDLEAIRTLAERMARAAEDAAGAAG